VMLEDGTLYNEPVTGEEYIHLEYLR
jgi:hypothetical protein